jgi:GTP-dependent phosphoenolpyruvate carboxykinase
LNVPSANLDAVLRVDVEAWLKEIPAIRSQYEKFGAKLPQGLQDELMDLEKRLQGASAKV